MSAKADLDRTDLRTIGAVEGLGRLTFMTDDKPFQLARTLVSIQIATSSNDADAFGSLHAALGELLPSLSLEDSRTLLRAAGVITHRLSEETTAVTGESGYSVLSRALLKFGPG